MTLGSPRRHVAAATAAWAAFLIGTPAQGQVAHDDPAGTATHEEAIRAARAASNAAIARHDVDAILSFLDDDFQVTAGNGSLLRGREAMAAGFRERFAVAADLRYVRTPTAVTVSSSAPLAWEEGRWVGTSTGPGGATRNGGRYAAQWREVDGVWKIRSELFVTLFCEGPDCD